MSVERPKRHSSEQIEKKLQKGTRCSAPGRILRSDSGPEFIAQAIRDCLMPRSAIAFLNLVFDALHLTKLANRCGFVSTFEPDEILIAPTSEVTAEC